MRNFLAALPSLWSRASLVVASGALLALCHCDDSAESSEPSGSGGTTNSTSTGGSSDTTSSEASGGGAATGPTGGGGAGDDVYRPDNGPTHEGGTVVAVCSESEILAAIADAAPGDVITVCPGTFRFDQLISVVSGGTADARVFLRAETRGTVTFELSHLENFKVSAPYWVFENLAFVGVCTDGTGCEHAFHLVGDADDLVFRGNEIVDFASHVKLNGEVVGADPAKSFPDRAWFIDNFWHNTKYIPNDAPHNILNLDGGRDHVVRGNLFADYNTPETLPKSASAIYPKASALGMLIEQNLIVCEKSRPSGETTRGIQLGDGAPASICDGDDDQDGVGDCETQGQSQLALVRNNIVMNCDNGGSAAGLMVGSDRGSRLVHNTVVSTGARKAGFYEGHPDHATVWRYNILEDGIETAFAKRPLDEADNLTPTFEELVATYAAPGNGDFALVAPEAIVDASATDASAPHDFCGYPRGPSADRGAIEYSTTHGGTPCATLVKQMFDRIP